MSGPADITLSNTGNVVIDQAVSTPTTVRLNAVSGAVTQLASGVVIERAATERTPLVTATRAGPTFVPAQTEQKHGQLGDQYRALMQEHINALTTKFSEHRIDYTMLNTSKPLDHALFTYLAMREKMMRVR